MRFCVFVGLGVTVLCALWLLNGWTKPATSFHRAGMWADLPHVQTARTFVLVFNAIALAGGYCFKMLKKRK